MKLAEELTTLFSQEQIAARVRELGAQIEPPVAPIGSGKRRMASSTSPPILLPVICAPTTFDASSRRRAITKWSCRTSLGSSRVLRKS